MFNTRDLFKNFKEIIMKANNDEQKEIKALLSQIFDHEKKLVEKDSSMKNAILFELMYNKIVEKTESNIEALLYVNIFLKSKGLDLKLAKSRDSWYYTINGAQFICAQSVPLINIDGRVFKEKVDCYVPCNIAMSFFNEKKYIDSRTRQGEMNSKGGKIFSAVEKEIIGDETEKLFSQRNEAYVKSMVARNSIAFQAINNGIDNVEKVINEYKKTNNAMGWERTGRYEKFDESEGTFCTFYNKEEDEILHIWNKPDGGVRLLNEEMRYMYGDESTVDNDQELSLIQALHTL